MAETIIGRHQEQYFWKSICAFLFMFFLLCLSSQCTGSRNHATTGRHEVANEGA